MIGQKHLIKCRCVLPQFKNFSAPPTHQFVVFSKVSDDGAVDIKYSQCNNCGLIHKIVDLCTSEIVTGKEEMTSLITIDDVKLSLPSNLSNILERSNADLSTWEQAQFIIENKQWGSFVVLACEDDAGMRQIKYVRIMSETFFKVETSTRIDTFVPQEDFNDK